MPDNSFLKTFNYFSVLLFNVCFASGTFDTTIRLEDGKSLSKKSSNDGLPAYVVILIVLAVLAMLAAFFLYTWSWWKAKYLAYWRGGTDIRFPVPRRSPRPSDSELPPIARFPDSDAHGEFKVPTISRIDEDESNVNAHDWFQDPLYKNFPRANVVYIQEIGRGWFGKILEADVSNLSPMFSTVRAKVLEQREDTELREQMSFLHEARFYRDAKHENILKQLGHCIERTPYMLIYENWPLGDLKYYLIKNANRGQMMYSQGVLIKMAIDIAKGLEYMNQTGYAHGDLAARNCLVTNYDGKVIIGDYGFSTQKYRDDYLWEGQTAWPIRWAAPESLHCTLGSIHATKTKAMSNVWTFGIVLWEIFELGNTPYPELTNEQVMDQVVLTPTYVLEQPITHFLNMKTKETLRNITLSCWNREPEVRPTISNVLSTLTAIESDWMAIMGEVDAPAQQTRTNPFKSEIENEMEEEIL